MNYICGRCGSAVEARQLASNGTATCSTCGTEVARNTKVLAAGTVMVAVLGGSVAWRDALAQAGIPTWLVLAGQAGLMLVIAVGLQLGRRLAPVAQT